MGLNIAVALFSLALAFLELAFIRAPFSQLFLPVFVTLFFPSMLLHFHLEQRRAERVREMEARLPDALFQVASFPSGAPLEEVFESVAAGGFGALSEEFSLVSRQVRAGKSVGKALSDAAERAGSPLLERVFSLLSLGQRSGADLGSAFADIAEDALEMRLLSAEASAANAMQKYTLIVGGGVLVPIVLGLLLSIVSSLDFSGSLLGLPEANRVELLDAVVLGDQVYLGAFSIMASVFVAAIDGKGKALLYFVLLFSSSMLLFNAVRSASFV